MNDATFESAPREALPVTPASAWERSSLSIGRWLPYATLGLATVLSLFQSRPPWSQYLWTAALIVLAAGWVYCLYTRAPGDKRNYRVRMLVYFGGLLALSAALMLRQPIFFVFAITGLFHASELRPWPLVFLGVGLTSLLMNTIITGFPWPSRDSWLIFGTIIAVQTLAIGFGNFLNEKMGELTEQRRQALARLEAALAESAALKAELLTQARAAGVLEERQRLAREIHDTLAQGLIGIITQLEAVQQAQD